MLNLGSPAALNYHAHVKSAKFRRACGAKMSRPRQSAKIRVFFFREWLSSVFEFLRRFHINFVRSDMTPDDRIWILKSNLHSASSTSLQNVPLQIAQFQLILANTGFRAGETDPHHRAYAPKKTCDFAYAPKIGDPPPTPRGGSTRNLTQNTLFFGAPAAPSNTYFLLF